MKQTLLALIVIFSFALVFYYLAGLVEEQPKITEAQFPDLQEYEQERQEVQILPVISAQGSECKNDASRTCKTENGCSGNQVCYNGVWSQCQTIRVCRPGRVAQCPYDSCSFGLRTCSDCGDGWSACALPK